MQRVDMLGFRKQLIAAINETLADRFTNIHQESCAFVEAQGGNVEGLPSLVVHDAIVAVEEEFDNALRDHSAEDAFVSVSVTGKVEDFSLKTRRLTISLHDNQPDSIVLLLFNEKDVRISTMQGMLFCDGETDSTEEEMREGFGEAAGNDGENSNQMSLEHNPLEFSDRDAPPEEPEEAPEQPETAIEPME